MPANVILNIITNSTSWAQCRQKLQNYVGIYYTLTEFNDWIVAFDEWWDVAQYYK